MGIDEFGPGTFGEKATEEFGILSSDAPKMHTYRTNGRTK